MILSHSKRISYNNKFHNNKQYICIMYRFVTLFVCACPIAPIIEYLSNIVEIRVDANKLLRLSKYLSHLSSHLISSHLISLFYLFLSHLIHL